MKRFTIVFALALGLVGSAVAGPIPIYRNYGVVTDFQQIDAIAFDNHGTFAPTLDPAEGTLGNAPFIWDSQNTRYYTNSGLMTATLGFRFDYLAPRGAMYVVQPADIFTNSGIIYSQDAASIQTSIGSYYEGIGSYILASAKNIGNSGTISVGDFGLLNLTGQNVDLRDGVLLAGNFGDSVTRRGSYIATNQYENPYGVNDLSAMVGTNTINLSRLALGGTQIPPAGSGYGTWVYTNVGGTNTYVNIVFVRTNGLDPNTSVGVKFYGGSPVWAQGTNYDYNSMQAVVGVSVMMPDIVTGGKQPGSFYLIDTGAGQNPYTLWDNAAAPTTRPSAFEVTMGPPMEWQNGVNGNSPYSETMIYPGNTFTNPVVTNVYGSYTAQIGRNSEVSSGQFISLLDPLSYYNLSSYIADPSYVDPSNDTARVEINANRLDMSRARIRSEGFLSIRATNVTASTQPAIDAVAMNLDFGVTNGFLSISNVLPVSRIRPAGSLNAWAASWDQVETSTSTNAPAAGETNATVATNATYYKFHVLVVNLTLRTTMLPTIEDLTLRGKSVYVQDYARVINSFVVDSQNFEVNSAVTFFQYGYGTYGYGNLAATNFPRLKNLLVDPNGTLAAGNMMVLGTDTANGLATCTNQGALDASTVMIKAGTVENRGTIYSAYNGIYLDAKTLNLLNTVVPSVYGDSSSYVRAGQDVEIKAGRLFAQASVINGGNYVGGKLTLWVTNELSDGVSSDPSSASLLTNTWTARNGFALPLKPSVGDLFGTEFITTVTNYQHTYHVWAAEDRGATLAGFTDNAVIGHLALDRSGPGGVFHFSGVGARSAMYVDYLEFRNDAAAAYDTALAIAPNMTIYYAASNLDPSLLQSAYSNRLVWVPEFVGPNSTKLVKAHVGGQTNNVICNLSLANSKKIDSDGDGLVNANDTFPVDGSVLTVNVVGNGTVSPNENGRALLLGQNYSAMAVPAPGNLFAGWTWQNASPAPAADAKLAKISFTMRSNLVLTANFIPDPAVLRVIIDGNGTVAPVTAQRLVYGKTYTLTATPAPGNLFVRWTEGVESTAKTIRFVMRSNMVLHATFQTNNLPNYKGVYNGLFYVNNGGAILSSNDVALASSGAFRVTVGDTGAASGVLYMAANPSGYAFTTTFGQNGSAQAIVKRAGKPSLALQLQMNVGASNEISGHVIESENWDAVLLGDRAGYSATSKAPMAGSYRVALKGLGLGNAGSIGDGYGTVAISPLGEATLSFNLPDGTTVLKTALIGKNGRWPLYATRVGKDSLLGWITVDTNSATMSGKVSWIKQAGVTRYYNSGFNDTFDFVGSCYTVPTDRSGGLALRSPVLVLSGDAGVEGSYVLSFVPGTLTLTSADKSVSVVLTPKTGTFSGKVIDRNTRAAKAINGVLLQSQNVGLGLFYSGTASGEARLQNNE